MYGFPGYMHVGAGLDVHRPEGAGSDQYMCVGADTDAHNTPYMHVGARPNAHRPNGAIRDLNTQVRAGYKC